MGLADGSSDFWWIVACGSLLRTAVIVKNVLPPNRSCRQARVDSLREGHGATVVDYSPTPPCLLIVPSSYISFCLILAPYSQISLLSTLFPLHPRFPLLIVIATIITASERAVFLLITLLLTTQSIRSARISLRLSFLQVSPRLFRSFFSILSFHSHSHFHTLLLSHTLSYSALPFLSSKSLLHWRFIYYDHPPPVLAYSTYFSTTISWPARRRLSAMTSGCDFSQQYNKQGP